MTKAERYKVLYESASCQCSLEHIVVDTTRPQMIGGTPWVYEGVPQYEAVCGSLHLADAEHICRALNAMEQP